MDRRSIHATRLSLGEKAAKLDDRWGLGELSNTLDSRFRAGRGTAVRGRPSWLVTPVLEEAWSRRRTVDVGRSHGQVDVHGRLCQVLSGTQGSRSLLNST